ncbi:hypothetical protein [Pseudomonas sp. SO81]|uniref:hypothetical protein n=1 Tax=Pseudomonas sp. SO81 TaxID=2983246 RepID=UPI0025A4076F|nr:hypothetical protein [Pseudomonas sp. SO81]WJN60889.1 Phage protein [Pseudomonas sp. SO81]
MKERPILFSGAMVRAILEGRKTVTRRVVPSWQLPSKTRGEDIEGLRWMSVAQRHPRWGFGVFGATEEECMANYCAEYRSCCPYGMLGDRLWVRESTEADYDTFEEVVLARYCADKEPVLYEAVDEEGDPIQPVEHWNYPRDVRPSIHMPRSQARILLEITAVRVERLQDISEQQALAEGVRDAGEGFFDVEDSRHLAADPRESFASLWESINGAESWAANPWVWVVEFKRVTP